MIVSATIVLCAALQVAAPSAKAPLAKALASIQGSWQLTSGNGQDVPAGTDVSLTFDGDKYFQTQNGSVVERGAVKLAAGKPMAIDLIITEGNDRDKTQLGVVEVSGDTMKGKFAAPGAAERPTDFAVSDGAFVFAAKKKPK